MYPHFYLVTLYKRFTTSQNMLIRYKCFSKYVSKLQAMAKESVISKKRTILKLSTITIQKIIKLSIDFKVR